jgi:hypothetical protein
MKEKVLLINEEIIKKMQKEIKESENLKELHFDGKQKQIKKKIH